MGYTEILQMVNSDPSIALNEKIEYIGGVIPRGLAEITKSLGNTGNQKSDFVNIEGKGILIYCKYSMDGVHGGSVGGLYIDEGMSTEKVVNFAAYATTVLSVDAQQLLSAKLVNGITISGSCVVNQPIYFNKLRFSGSTGTGGGSFFMKYALFD